MLGITECMAAAELFFRIHEKLILQTAKEYDLSKTEIKALLFLYCYPGQDTAKAIVEASQIPKSCISKAIDGLEKKGCLMVKEDGEDRRLLRLSLKPQAAPVIQKVLNAQEGLAEALAADMTEEEKRELLRLGEKVVLNMNEILKSEAFP